MKSSKRTALTIAQVVLGLLVLCGAAWLVFKAVGYWQAQQVYKGVEFAYANDLSVDEDDPIDFVALQERYPDVVAWIKMDDVDVSYPVVQGSDNDFYLYNDLDGQACVAGSIFLDYRTQSLDTDRYAIMYGHNMRDESMFGRLDDYLSKEFYEKGTDSFTVYTPKKTYRYKIFAVNVVDPTDEVFTMGYVNTGVFDGVVREMKANSIYDTGVEVAGSDHVLTLSTCSDSDRLVLSAKRM